MRETDDRRLWSSSPPPRSGYRVGAVQRGDRHDDGQPYDFASCRDWQRLLLASERRGADASGRGAGRQPRLSSQLPRLGRRPGYADFCRAGPGQHRDSAGALGLSGTTQGPWFRGSRRLSCSKRNEDDSVFDDRDELYAGVRLVTGFSNGQYGPTVKSAESNRITGYF